jgi:MazG family protein
MATPTENSAKQDRLRAIPSPLERVLALARTLREPDGCPWDQEQTVETLTPYLQEETFEVVEAVAERDREAFREELGDLLFLVLFLGAVAEESGWGTLEEVGAGVVEKLVRRHPHVFGEGPEVGSRGALRQWEEIKRDERAEAAPAASVPSALGDRPSGLPALTTAFRISEKAGAVGFQWPDIRGALAKLDEEIGEFREELDAGARPHALEREIGDILYSVVNVARYLRIDPERALRGTTAKFQRRFRYIEGRLHERGLSPERVSLDEMGALWDEAKAEGID